MDKIDSITISAKRKRGQHLQAEERGAIQALKAQGYSNRAIARILDCAPTTVGNELKRGTPPRKSSKGRAPSYSAKRGEAAYKANRAACVKPLKAVRCKAFLAWVVTQMRDHKWSLDACCGHAKRHQLFRTSEMVCTRTLYNMVWANLLPVKVTELPEALKHSSRKHKNQENKKCYGASISKRPEIASLCTKKGH